MDFHNVTIESMTGAAALVLIFLVVVFIKWMMNRVIKEHGEDGDK